jgi:GNAT superfamily N-acetyltransferase
MSQYTTRPLDIGTWDAFARLCEKHNGMGFGGCWCTWFHPRRKDLDIDVEAGLVSLPDYRLTCIFVDRNHRREGVAAVALDGALDLIARAGGGVVEAYPQDTAGKKISSSFLYDGTRSMFEKAGFDYERPKGKNHCVMRKIVSAA